MIFDYKLIYHKMSKEIFKNITNSIEMWEKTLIKSLIKIFKRKIELFRKLLELVGDKEDKCYEEFFNINIKEFKLKKNYYCKFINIFNNFKNINEFIEIIIYNNNIYLDDEIMNLLDNIFITPPSSPLY